jgi:hypothetical protein
VTNPAANTTATLYPMRAPTDQRRWKVSAAVVNPANLAVLTSLSPISVLCPLFRFSGRVIWRGKLRAHKGPYRSSLNLALLSDLRLDTVERW